MKRVLCFLSLVLAFLVPQAVSYAQTPYIPYWDFQHRIYESGLEIYRIQFYVRTYVGSPDPNNDPYYDVDDIGTVTLQRDGTTYVFQRDYAGEDYLVTLYKDHTYWGQYDGDTGHFNYDVDGAGDLNENYRPLWCLSIFNFDAYSFPTGSYNLSVTFDNAWGTIYGDNSFDRSDIVPLPVIDSSTITAECTPQGMWFRWEAPYEMFDDVDTSTRPAIILSEVGSSLTTHEATGYNLYTRVPFHMGGLFIPDEILDQLEEKTFVLSGEDTADFFQQTRTSDNSERRYSNHALFSFADCKIKVEKEKKKKEK